MFDSPINPKKKIVMTVSRESESAGFVDQFYLKFVIATNIYKDVNWHEIFIELNKQWMKPYLSKPVKHWLSIYIGTHKSMWFFFLQMITPELFWEKTVTQII